MAYERDYTENWLVEVPIQKPDWSDPDEYEYIDDLNDIELAWECLRRNPDYIKGFHGWSSLMQHYSASFTFIEKMPHNITDIDAYREEALDSKKEADKLCDGLCEKFRLSKKVGLLNPYKSALRQGRLGMRGSIFEVDELPDPVLLKYWIDGEEVIGLEDIVSLDSRLCMDVRIVAERSIEEQLEVIKTYYEMMHRRGNKRLKELKKKTVRVRREFKNYLRIFDAGAAGLENRQIAEILYPDMERNEGQNLVYRYLKKAKEWVDFGYLKLIPNHLNG